MTIESEIDDIIAEIANEHPEGTEEEIGTLLVQRCMTDPAASTASVEYALPGDDKLPDPRVVCQAIIDQQPGITLEECMKQWRQWWDNDPELRCAVMLDFVRTKEIAVVFDDAVQLFEQGFGLFVG